MSDIPEIAPRKTPLRRRQKLSMALLGLVILTSGFVLGASGAFFLLRDEIPHVPPPRPTGRNLERLSEDLKLDAAQKEQVRTLLDDQHAKFREIFREVDERMRVHYDEMVVSMKSILTEDQFARWEEDLKSHMERRGRGPGQWRGGGPREFGGPDSGRNGRRNGGRGRPDRKDKREGHPDAPPSEPEPNPAP